MCHKLIFTTFFLLIFITCGFAWHKSNFNFDSKLPKECGRIKIYSPENYYESWGFWPWLGIMTFYYWEISTRCNVVLIHPQAVITSLMCIRHIPEIKLEESLFITFSLPGLPSFQNISVTNIDFTGTSYNTGDSLAILRLSKPVIISARVQPICLWEQNHDYSAQLTSHIGMVIGADFNNLYALAELRVYQAPVRIISKQKCIITESNIFNVTEENPLCFTYYREPVTCHGFGSTLIFPRLSESGEVVWYLRSIITLRRWFCDNDHLYTTTFDIADRREWIESHFKPSTENTCGRRASIHTPLIISGNQTNRGDWPWHAAIYVDPSVKGQNRVYHCGGSLISPQFVLTAGHCVVSSSGVMDGKLSVKLGKHDLTKYERNSFDIRVSEIILHDQYNAENLRNDIALLMLERKVAYNSYIRPVCLWHNEDIDKRNVYNHNGKVPGWGLNERNYYPDTMYVANIPIMDDIYCYQTHATFYDTFLTNYTLCAGNPRSNDSSVCNGDSGGGLVLPINQDDQEITWYLRGIVSLTVRKPNQNTCDPDYYGIYTDVAQYLNWISFQMNLI